jgi:hypothetical protein
MCAVMLQSCTVSLEVVPGLSSETGITSSDDSQAVIDIKIENDSDVAVKVVEIPELISFPPLKAEPEEVSYLTVCQLSDMSVTSLCAHCRTRHQYP